MGANVKLTSIRQFERMGANVGVKCWCGRVVTIAPAVLFRIAERKGYAVDRIDLIRQSLKCSQCGEKGRVRIGLSYDLPGG